MPNGEFEFDTSFNEFLPIVQGVTRIWVGDGSTGEIGSLYAQYANGTVVNLGSVSLYSLAQSIGHYEGTDAEWVQDVVRIASEQRGVSISVTYQASDDGDVHPDASIGWSETPSPEEGRYLWSKYVVTWYDGGLSAPYYSVAYMGKDGGVTSVNGLDGVVALHGENINIDDETNESIKQYIDESIENIPAPPVTSVNSLTGDIVLYGNLINIDDNTNETIKEYIDNLTPETATNAEIDAMFGIVS